VQAPGNAAPPTESIEVAIAGTYRIEIRYEASGSIPPDLQLDLTLISQDQDLPSAYRVAARSINDPSTFESVIAVGAVGDVSAAMALSDEATPSSSIQRRYSSEGPTADGRMKPDFAAADCVATSVVAVFCGTSGASPHAAGIAALIMQASGAPAAEVGSLLRSMAVDRGPVGPDNRYGHGVLDLGFAPSGQCGGVPATIIALPGQIEIHGTSGPDVIRGNHEANSIWGYAGDDRICGGRGRDVIRPGSGDDRVWGQRGSDRVIYKSGNDIIRGGKGAKDMLDLRLHTVPATIDLKAKSGSIGGAILSIRSMERVFGGSGNDVISGSGRDEVLKGFGGDDVLLGRGGDDRLFGGAGSDWLDGGRGNDFLDGGRGNDTCINGETNKHCES
jgi:subtilisin family serine protease